MKEAEKLRKKNIAMFYGKSKVMKDDCCFWDGWLDRADGHMEIIRRRHSNDDFTVDYKSVQYKTNMITATEGHEIQQKVMKMNQKVWRFHKVD